MASKEPKVIHKGETVDKSLKSKSLGNGSITKVPSSRNVTTPTIGQKLVRTVTSPGLYAATLKWGLGGTYTATAIYKSLESLVEISEKKKKDTIHIVALASLCLFIGFHVLALFVYTILHVIKSSCTKSKRKWIKLVFICLESFAVGSLTVAYVACTKVTGHSKKTCVVTETNINLLSMAEFNNSIGLLTEFNQKTFEMFHNWAIQRAKIYDVVACENENLLKKSDNREKREIYGDAPDHMPHGIPSEGEADKQVLPGCGECLEKQGKWFHFRWTEPVKQTVFLSGTFLRGGAMIQLNKDHANAHCLVANVPVGHHEFNFCLKDRLFKTHNSTEPVEEPEMVSASEIPADAPDHMPRGIPSEGEADKQVLPGCGECLEKQGKWFHFRWTEPVKQTVFLSGTFLRGGAMIQLNKDHANAHCLVANVPVGHHEFKFYVDGGWKVSRNYGISLDSYGDETNFVHIK